MADVIDKDLAAELRVAKKKPRNFAIVAKGPNVLKLLVQKKPIKDGTLIKAKQEVHGNAIVKGVVSGGDGPELVFQVAEESSVGVVKLRAFITDHTNLTLKPRFEVVSELAEVDEDEEESLRSESEGSEATADSSETEAGSPATPSAEKLTEMLKTLVPLAQKALTAQPGRKDEILAPAAAIKSLLGQGQLDRARDQLQAYALLLKELLGASATSGTGRVSLVALGKARLEWLSVRDTGINELRRLKVALQDEFKDDPEQASELSAALATLDQKIKQLDSRLHEELDAVLNADESAREPLVRTARSTISSLLNFLASDPVMTEVDDNEVVPGMVVKAPLEAQLNAISAALG